MPNYSHGTNRLTVASVEEPPYLTIGTDVSAKYKGAFCEAKIIDVSKHVKLRVLFEGSSGTHLIDDTDLKTGSVLETGTRIEAKHPEKKKKTYVQANIVKILDNSRYTVVFDDGDQCVLRRNSLCLKSGKHFAESETLDQLPLTNPEHFSNPVKVGAHEQLNNLNTVHTTSISNSKTQSAHQQLLSKDDKSRGAKSSSSTINSSSTTSEDTKTNTNGTELNNIRKRQPAQDYDNYNVKKTKRERTSNHISTPTGTGRRGAPKGRKRRESINNGSKHVTDLEDDSVEDSQDSGDCNPGEASVNYELIEVGVKLMVQYGKGKVQNVYEAKVNKITTTSAGKTKYYVHYTGWNNRYDEWITKNRILSIVTEKENGVRDGRSRDRQSEIVAVVNVSTVTTSSSVSPAASITTTTAALPVSKLENDVVDPTRIQSSLVSSTSSITKTTTSITTITTLPAPKREPTPDPEPEPTQEQVTLPEQEPASETNVINSTPTATSTLTVPLNITNTTTLPVCTPENNVNSEPFTTATNLSSSASTTSSSTTTTISTKEKKSHLYKIRPIYKFCEGIEESDCDKKISILQERILGLRQTYTSLKAELADLDRRRTLA